MDDSARSKCLVCSTPNTALHLGMDVCRACSNFFKRTLLANRQYPCRQGDHICHVLKDVRPMCRGCRFDKCVAIGMKYDRTAIIEPIVVEKPESLLDRIAKEHAASVGRRRLQEMELIKQHKLVRLPHPSEEVYLATFDCVIESWNLTISENWKFFLKVFPTINHLPYVEQREFFRLCVPQFALAECFYRTKKIWGGFTKYLMCSLFMVAEINHPEKWIRQNEPNRDELIESLRAHSDEQMALVVPSFEKADICERELHALIALLLCEADLHSDFACRFKPFLRDVRHEILKDLHRFYTENMKLTDYSTRLGNLMTICHTFREGNALFQEYFRMQVTIFDLYVTATQLQELFL